MSWWRWYYFLRFRCQVSHIYLIYQDQNQSSSPRFAAQGYCARLSLSHHLSLTLVSVVLSMTMVQLSHSETSLSDRLKFCYLTFDIIMCFTIYWRRKKMPFSFFFFFLLQQHNGAHIIFKYSNTVIAIKIQINNNNDDFSILTFGHMIHSLPVNWVILQ